MAFDFPANPVQGDIFTDTITGSVYIWNSYAWGRKYSEPPVGATHPPAETIPVEPPIDGETTVDAVLRNLSVEVDALATESGNKVDVAGDTMTGPLILSEHPTAASPEFQAATKGFVGAGGLPLGGLPGEALVIDATGVAAWGAPINADVFVTATSSGKVSDKVEFGKNQLPRWSMNLGDKDDDADFHLQRFNDGGGSMGSAIRVSRQTGDIDFGSVPTVKGKKLVDQKYVSGLELKINTLEAEVNALKGIATSLLVAIKGRKK